MAVGHTYGSDGFEKDEREALSWFQRVAAQGNLQALYNLAWLHEFGEEVPADPAEAERLYNHAAALGHPEASEALGQSGPR